MRLFNKLSILALSSALVLPTACSLDVPLENVQKVEATDYTQTENMMLLVYGAYAQLNELQWESFPTIALRGDDVNPAGDQQPLIRTDLYDYDRNFWLYNSTWLNLYSDIIYWHGAMEELTKYQEAGASAALTNQYIAEMKVMRSFELLQLARLWSDILIPRSSQPSDLYNVELSTFDEVMEHISAQMDEAIPNLAAVRPNQRTDVPGGITRYTALAVKAMANLEMHNYQAAADATGEIIAQGGFALMDDYYQLFKIPGKLSSESLMELQYSDYGTATGTVNRYLWDFFGPASWTPSVSGAGGGWGFWEPSIEYVKFMLGRGERERLEATVLFTPDGIAQVKSDPAYATLPSWVSNVTKDGDVFNNHPRYKFLSGKHYLPSKQLTAGRFTYGENKNFSVIRYSEVLLMHAEALTSGATSSVMSASDAVNAVRARVGMAPLSSVTLDQVLDEKLAEFATEWGIRFFDLVRHGKTAPLSYGGRTYTDADRFLPYPLEQQDILPQLKDASKP
ncbi:RagB/SusD family nutrient uptake outer membrane protein [Algoriphagus sp. H41]|uniref:RagB/SusD family nutrient uptake outer membrane protein n=1 Tax=Algoriphagus oliviformis TaxID=2811231 RepID=A0ABS3CC03_9BACT|nr:RagB/SusD family nutrient uptake outer membrane protein [Algoriphagus oliviformis]MBN7813691.1 RagB/SusD family nutrient uptake outer membrane protein [Algoriphagus oliviformis]